MCVGVCACVCILICQLPGPDLLLYSILLTVLHTTYFTLLYYIHMPTAGSRPLLWSPSRECAALQRSTTSPRLAGLFRASWEGRERRRSWSQLCGRPLLDRTRLRSASSFWKVSALLYCRSETLRRGLFRICASVPVLALSTLCASTVTSPRSKPRLPRESSPSDGVPATCAVRTMRAQWRALHTGVRAGQLPQSESVSLELQSRRRAAPAQGWVAESMHEDERYQQRTLRDVKCRADPDPLRRRAGVDTVAACCHRQCFHPCLQNAEPGAWVPLVLRSAWCPTQFHQNMACTSA